MEHQVTAVGTGPHRATAGDRDRVVEILVGAFYDDPLWGWAFPDDSRRRDQHRALWGLSADGGLRYPWVWLSEGDTAAAVWVPPGGTELSSEQEAQLEPLLTELVGAGAGRVMDVFDRLNAVHPHEEPHYFLSLLGTDPAHRGHGFGLRLLADTLGVIDAEQMPAYLEASNPVNVGLYARYGFELLHTLTIPGGPEVATMWRPAQAV